MDSSASTHLSTIELEDPASFQDCLELTDQVQRELTNAVNQLQTQSSVSLTPIPLLSAPPSSRSQLSHFNNIVNAHNSLLTSHISMTSITSNLLKAVSYSQQANQYLIKRSEEEFDEGPLHSKRPRTGDSRKKRNTAFEELIHYHFKLLIGMAHKSKNHEITRGDHILADRVWPPATPSGFFEVSLATGEEIRYERPRWNERKAAAEFLARVLTSVQGSTQTIVEKLSDNEVSKSILKYYNTVSQEWCKSRTGEAKKVKLTKQRQKRRKDRVSKVIQLRTLYFNSSPLAASQEVDFLKQAVLSEAVVYDELSSADKEKFIKEDGIDEREIYRHRAVGLLSTVSQKVYQRRERWWLSSLVRVAGATLDAHIQLEKATSASTSQSMHLRALTFPIPRKLSQQHSPAAPSIRPKDPEGDPLEGTTPIISRSVVSSRFLAEHPHLQQCLYPDPRPIGQDILKPLFRDVIQQERWKDVSRVAKQSLHTPRLLSRDQLGDKMREMDEAERLEWEDETEDESDLEVSTPHSSVVQTLSSLSNV